MKFTEFLVLFCFVFRRSNCDDFSTRDDSTWNGDPNICVKNTFQSNPTDPPLPVFPDQAEFVLEQMTLLNYSGDLRTQQTLYRYFYDYSANKLIRYTNDNGMIDSEFFYYEIGKISIYDRSSRCVVMDIPEEDDADGISMIRLPDGSTHIRPLSDFLLFSRNDPRKEEIRPRFIEQRQVRGVTVNLWESCIIDRERLRTEQRLWSMAASSVVATTGKVNEAAVPIEMISRSSLSNPDGDEYFQVEEIFNFYAYRPGITQSIDQLLPERTTFCSNGADQNLISLREAKMIWPSRFSVRVQASTSRSNSFQHFRLTFNNGPEHDARIVRYDYLPIGNENYRSLIFDHELNLTFSIDEQAGSCRIERMTHLPDVDPTVDPVGFFIKHERRFLLDLDARLWESNGERVCRDNSIVCRTLTSKLDNFPTIVESDTGDSTDESWESTIFEYAWSNRSPNSRPADPDEEKMFDYPVYLYMRHFRRADINRPSNFDLSTEQVRYEFFEISTETNPSDFDTNFCYREGRFEYLHLFFILTSNVADSIDQNRIDRRYFERTLHALLANRMRIRYSRISSIDFQHEKSTNEVLVVFTLLGKTAAPGSPTGLDETEISAAQAADRLKLVIQGNNFQFDFLLNDEISTEVRFRAKNNSLDISTSYRSVYSTGNAEVEENYSTSSEVLAVILGLFIGLLTGAIIAAIFRLVRKDPMPKLPFISRTLTNPVADVRLQKENPSSSNT